MHIFHYVDFGNLDFHFKFVSHSFEGFFIPEKTSNALSIE